MLSLILNSSEYFILNNTNTINDIYCDLCINISDFINRIYIGHNEK